MTTTATPIQHEGTLHKLKADEPHNELRRHLRNDIADHAIAFHGCAHALYSSEEDEFGVDQAAFQEAEQGLYTAVERLGLLERAISKLKSR